MGLRLDAGPSSASLQLSERAVRPLLAGPSSLPVGFSPQLQGLPCTVNNLLNFTPGPWLPASVLLPNLIALQRQTLTTVLPVFSQPFPRGIHSHSPHNVIFGFGSFILCHKAQIRPLRNSVS